MSTDDGAEGAPEQAGKDPQNWVPMSRFREVNGKAQALAERVDAMSAELEAAKGTATQATSSLAEYQTKLEQAEARRAEDVALVRAGIDDDLGMDLARMYWGKQPEDQRKPLTEAVQEWRAAPDSLPRPLQAYFAAPPAAAAAPPEPPPPEPAGLPPANNGTRPSGDPGSVQHWSVEAIRTMSADELRKNLPEIMRDIRGKP